FLKALQEVRVSGDAVIDNLDGAHFVEGEVPDAVDNAHPAHADPIQNLVLVANDHPRLQLMRALQSGLIRGTDVIVGRIGLMTGGAVFHSVTPSGQKSGNPGWPATDCLARNAQAETF